MLAFLNDYSEGAHEKILRRLTETNLIVQTGYGTDEYTLSAKERIRAACACPEAEIVFISGGTQTNQLVISTVLRRYESVLCPETGHINGHEAGAIEYTGNKVIGLPHTEGKLSASTAEAYLKNLYANDGHDHMTSPGMIYISHPTEYGTLYTKEELTDLREVCDAYNLTLFVDGARLGYALASPKNDISLADMARLTDVFYIGGTKVGALCGEAVVFTKKNMPRHYLTQIKQHGALLAKGRLLGIQFDTLFADNLYTEIAKSAIRSAMRLQEIFVEKGYRLLFESPTNQVFVILDNETMARLREQVMFTYWEKYDDTHTVVRFVTSWATDIATVEALAALL